MSADFRVPRAKAYRLTAEAARLDAQAYRLFYTNVIPNQQRAEEMAEHAEKLAADYDAMADAMEADIYKDTQVAA